MKTEVVKLAKLLRTSEEVISDLEKKMEKISGKKGVIEKIIWENEQKLQEKLKELGFGSLILKDSGGKPPTAEQVHRNLVNKTKETDQLIFNYCRKSGLPAAAGYQNLFNLIREQTGQPEGFYLKKEKAKELLRLNPPKNILSDLGYGSDVDEMLKQEDIFEIFAALRFAEDSNWLNNVFFRSYLDLKKEDFEKRKIEMMILPERWTEIGQKFLGKKLHHMSHLKELGIVFVIPVKKALPDETLYILFMTLHYIYEVGWYSRLFEMYSRQPDFAKRMTEALKVKTSTMALTDGEKMSWRIVTSYLAKKNRDDPRLKEPHINSESLHYDEAIEIIGKLSQNFPQLGLSFWQGLSVVAGYFPSDDSKEELVSFDLFDNGISLLGRVDFGSRYLYHQQDALWNKLFVEYMGEEAINRLIMENLDKGYIEFKC